MLLVHAEASPHLLIGSALAALADGFTDPPAKDGRPGFDHGAVARLRRGATLIDAWSVLYDRFTTGQAVLLLPADSAAKALRAWGLVLQGMALMAPNPHAPGRSPGAVLASAGLSETRVSRLLRAEGEAFDALFLSICRFLRAEGFAVDWIQFGRLALERVNAPGVSHTDIANQIIGDFVHARQIERMGEVSVA